MLVSRDRDLCHVKTQIGNWRCAIHTAIEVQLGMNNGPVQHLKCVSIHDHSNEVESLLALCHQSIDVFLKERCESHHSPWNFVDSSTGRGVFPTPTVVGLRILVRGAVKRTTVHLRVANLKSFLVAHSCIPFSACCTCLFIVSRQHPNKQIDR